MSCVKLRLAYGSTAPRRLMPNKNCRGPPEIYKGGWRTIQGGMEKHRRGYREMHKDGTRNAPWGKGKYTRGDGEPYKEG